MKVLKDILYKASLLATEGDTGIEISSVVFDSRRVEKDCVFVAVSGTQVDGHQFIAQATEQGATAVVAERLPEARTAGVTYVQVGNSAEALGVMAANFYDNPSAKLQLVAVTGTNGKTTVVTLLHQLFIRLGYPTGLLSTVNNKINDEVIPATHTTPDAVQLSALLAQMVRRGCTHAFMEASSHAIAQHRTSGLQLAGAVFTNITHDHLDYHETFENYIAAKKMLFDGLPREAFALVNVDDKRGRVMLQNTKAQRNTYSLKSASDFKGKVISNTLEGLELEVGSRDTIAQPVWFNLIGDFNAYNLVAAYGVAVLLGVETVRRAYPTVGRAPGAGPLRADHLSGGSHRYRGLRPHPRCPEERAENHSERAHQKRNSDLRGGLRRRPRQNQASRDGRHCRPTQRPGDSDF